jgi:hypothetical protein
MLIVLSGHVRLCCDKLELLENTGNDRQTIAGEETSQMVRVSAGKDHVRPGTAETWRLNGTEVRVKVSKWKKVEGRWSTSANNTDVIVQLPSKHFNWLVTNIVPIVVDTPPRCESIECWSLECSSAYCDSLA